MRKILAVVGIFALLMGISTVLSACNTTAGAGRDMAATGNALTNSANQNKP
jgi:predicted small secreted protein